MSVTPYPLPRETRESAVSVGNGTVGPYGPSLYKIFDTADVKVFAKLLGATVYSDVTANCTIAKVNPASAYDYFTVTFNAPVLATTSWKHQARRTAERSVAVTKAGTITAAELEKELSKQASAQSELRRDVDRAYSAAPGGGGGVILPGADGELMQSDGAGNIEGSGENVTTILGSTATAVAAAVTATTKAGEASQSANNALAWAATPENTPVPGGGGLFSALHYAAKAAASATILSSLIAGITALWLTVLQTTTQAAAWVALSVTGYSGTRTAIKAMTPAAGMTVLLTELGRFGAFECKAGAQPFADPQEGVYFASNTAGFYFERKHTPGLNVFWFGAKNDNTAGAATGIQAAIDLAVLMGAATTEGPVGAVYGPPGRYQTAATITIPKSIKFRLEGTILYTPTAGDAVLVTPALTTQHTFHDIFIAGIRAVNGNATVPTSINAAGCTGMHILRAQFSNIHVGQIIGFTKYNVWLDSSNTAFTGQHIQDNDLTFDQLSYGGAGLMAESVSAADGAVQVNRIKVQNSFSNFRDIDLGKAGDVNTNHNQVSIAALDVPGAGGTELRVFGSYNKIDLGFVDTGGAVRFEAGSVSNLIWVGRNYANVTYVDGGTGNLAIFADGVRRGTERFLSQVTGSEPISLESNDSGASFAQLLELYKNSATPAANDGGAGIMAKFNNDALVKITGGRLRYVMPTVASGNENLQWLIATMYGGVLADRIAIWGGLNVDPALAGDMGIGTVNISQKYYVLGTQVVGPRATGWTAGTGTALKTAWAAYAGQTHTGAYVQATVQALDDNCKNTSQRVKAIEDALRTHGLIN